MEYGDSATEDSPTGVASVESLSNYIYDITKSLLPGSDTDLSNTIKKDKSSLQKLALFIENVKESSIFLVKAKSDDQHLFQLIDEFNNDNLELSSIVIITKLRGDLTQNTEWQSQVMVTKIPSGFQPQQSGSNSFEKLKALINIGIVPYFNTLVGGAEANGSQSINVTKRKFYELVLSLQHLQQNIPIPNLGITAHPRIKEVVANHPHTAHFTADILDDDLINESTFLNSLQNIVNDWVKQVQNVTALTHNPEDSDSISEEINFWASKETALNSIKEQLSQTEVQLTLDILRSAKRFHATTSFLSDTGIQDSLNICVIYNSLLHDLPITEILSSQTFDKLKDSIESTFSHLKKLRITAYPIDRSIKIVETLCKDINSKLLKLLSDLNIMSLSYDEFLVQMKLSESVLEIIEENIRDFTSLVRELVRKRSDKFMVIKIKFPAFLEDRLKIVQEFREKHNGMLKSIHRLVKGLKADDSSFIKDIEYAYDAVRDIDCFNSLIEGLRAWKNAEQIYHSRSVSVENNIIQLLKTTLNTAQSSTEMFSMFEKFGFLLERPNVRSALQEYQSQLLAVVQEQLTEFQKQFQFQLSVQKVIQLRDIPSFSSTLMWINEMNYRLNFLVDKLELVLTEEWSRYPEGKKIHNEVTLLQEKLHPEKIISNWLSEASESLKNPITRQQILFLDKFNSANNKELSLSVNFDEKSFGLANEVNSLTLMGVEVPRKLQSVAKSIELIYPYVNSINDSFFNLESILASVDQLGDLKLVLLPLFDPIFESIAILAKSEWSGLAKAQDLLEANLTDVEEVQVLNSVIKFENQIMDLIIMHEALLEFKDKLAETLEEFKTCDYENMNFMKLIARLQALVNELFLNGYSNVDRLVDKFNAMIYKLLFQRCRAQLSQYISYYKPNDNDEFVVDDSGHVKRHHIIIQDRNISIKPPLEVSKEQAIGQINEVISVVSCQKTLYKDKFDVKRTNEEHVNTFDSIEIGIVNEYCKSISIVNDIFITTSNYVNEWLQLRSLWDLNLDEVKQVVGTDLVKWIDALSGLRESRSTFDTVDVYKKFGPIIIEYEQAQSRINSQYDHLQKQIADEFVALLTVQMKKADDELIGYRKKIESLRLDFKSPTAVLLLVSTLQKTKIYIEDILPTVQILKNGQVILTKLRFKFPKDWLFFDQILSDYDTLVASVAKRSVLVESNIESLAKMIQNEQHKLVEVTEQAKLKWLKEKPIGNKITANGALTSLSAFESMLTLLCSRIEDIVNASNFLKIVDEIEDLNLTDELDEIKELKSVWTSISELSKQSDKIGQQKWKDVSILTLRKSLEDVLANSRSMPIAVRQYSAFERIQESIKSFLRCMITLKGLKSDSMKSSHWDIIFKQLCLKPAPQNLKLNDIFNLDISKNEKFLKTIIDRAQSEEELNTSIESVERSWREQNFELFQYNNKYRIVRGWADLFNHLTEDLNSLSSMKLSPYFDTFEKRVELLEEQLNSIYGLLDTWIDVQRQWVYLAGVFDKNEEIKRLLPIESTRFTNTTSEFFTLLKPVYKSLLVFDILSVRDMESILSRVSDTLKSVVKSLMGYLEKQREQWPRFYFIGNEDLLEIIGNTRNIDVVSKHMKKMFAGISELIYDKELNLIKGIISPENETVTLSHTVSLIAHHSLNDWLTQLDIEVKKTLALLLTKSLTEFESFWSSDTLNDRLLDWIKSFPNQILILTLQIHWTQIVEKSEGNIKLLNSLHGSFKSLLGLLSTLVLNNLNHLDRIKIENIVIEVLHQENVIEGLLKFGSSPLKSSSWIMQQRYYVDYSSKLSTNGLIIKQGNASFIYGFEYLGAPNRLVYTPLMDTCFASLTETLNQRLGGSLVGPAGTGKTESVKALGQNLGRMVLVFCCDETFDYQAVSRILIGICRTGAWGCFDEFNRLDEKMLSAIATEIEKIENALGSETSNEAEILGKKVQVNQDSGIFITSNPGYAGRTVLPDNLKNKYRTFSIVKPDSRTIAEVMLTSQGFYHAKFLSNKVVPLFISLDIDCSHQSHYDFGLRALKSVLRNCGALKRLATESTTTQDGELQLVIRSLFNVVLPKLLAKDEPVFESAIQSFGLEFDLLSSNLELIGTLKEVAAKHQIAATDDWLKKALQLFEIQNSHHGLILVGSPGCGKSTIFRCLIEALTKISGKENVYYNIDPKVLGKSDLYGDLDYATRDWTDGVFTSILRKVNSNFRGEDSKQVWVVFDGDVDPNWVENLNSVLDDNKLLTLPNGERISLPDNLKIVFEVDNLDHATPATVSRCGVIWFGSSLYSMDGFYNKLLFDFKNSGIDNDAEFGELSSSSIALEIKALFANSISSVLSPYLLEKLWDLAGKYFHIMNYSFSRCMNTFFALQQVKFKELASFIIEHPEYSFDDVNSYVGKTILTSLVWSFLGDSPLVERKSFAQELLKVPELLKYSNGLDDSLIYSYVSLPDLDWESYNLKVPTTVIEPYMIIQPDVVIPTLDTVRHEDLIYSLLNERKPVILCGPPGSGKTMTLMAALRKSNQFIFVGLNFSKETAPDQILKTIEHHCIYKKTSNGSVLTPSVSGKWLIVFCDEINLPELDSYGTQTTISFLRQLAEQNRFWKKSTHEWVSLHNIQFVGACNPPTDPGRNALSNRFLRHCSLFMVDYPGEESLSQIYKTFNYASLKSVPDLMDFSDSLTGAMIHVYQETRIRFKTSNKMHYIYSPRELTRWVRGIFEAIKQLAKLSLGGLIRLWAHEGLRIFSDRLSEESEREWTFKLVMSTASSFFPNLDYSEILQQPILYSDWLGYEYGPVSEKELYAFVDQKLKMFSEEETSVSLVLSRDLLDHVLRIDRVLKNSQGHLILVGPCSSGKTTLAKFVSWMNGLKVFQLNVSRKYTLQDFDKTLRKLLYRVGAEGEKISFIIDESTILETAFIERMNTLLANAEIPGLFEGDDLSTLLSACSRNSQQQGLFLESDEELYAWFTKQVAQNFHVVFTIDDPYLANAPQIIASPALFNRCVLNWMGDWSKDSYFVIASELLNSLPLEKSDFAIPKSFSNSILKQVSTYRDVVVDVLVFIHHGLNDSSRNQDFTPGNFLNLIANFISIFTKKEWELQNYQTHVNVGLDKMRETVLKVKELNHSLSEKKIQLAIKDKEARIMLDKMIVDQNEAERKQDASYEIQTLLESQEKSISERRTLVLNELSEVEPLIEEAQKGVKNIKKQHLTELRSMLNPPEAVKLTLESVCILLGYDVQTWREVVSVIRRDDFITNIVRFNSETHLTDELANYMELNYLSRPNYTFEAVNRASKACGPMLLWVQAQLRYAKIIKKVEPLRNEVLKVETELKQTKQKLIALDGMIKDLQTNIEKYKYSYSDIIRETESIKAQMQDVELKVVRSKKLLESLSEERSRWANSIHNFKEQRECLVGDSILAASCMTYIGIFDQIQRNELISGWKNKLESSVIEFTKTFNFVAVVSKPTDVLQWQQHGLPNDDLFLENTTVLTSKTSERFSFIIDPSGQMVDFLTNYTKPKQLVVTSFLDDGYVKQLESCIRFGGPLLIQDGEYFDPMINRVIAKEVELSGGRNLVRLGDKTIDLSPDFKLYIHTKDPSVKISPFVSSRMNILNFTFTAASLITQSLNSVLKHENPKLEKQRLELLKVNGEWKQKVLDLEDDLLFSLNSTEKSILENDKLVDKLEVIKSEVGMIRQKMKESDGVIEETESSMRVYRPIADLFARLYMLLDKAWKLNPIYRFPDNLLEQLLHRVLDKGKGNDVDYIINLLVKETYSYTAISLLQKDRAILESCLCSLSNGNPEFEDISVTRAVNESDLFILRSSEGFDSADTIAEIAKLSGKETVSYAMGSSKGLEIATKIISEASKKGKWVIIENVQMSSVLLDTIPKLYKPQPNFKLFLTCQINSRLPIVLSKISRQIIFEANPGVKLLLEDSLLSKNSVIYLDNTSIQPVELKKLYFGLAWMYSVLKEKLRFAPIGFTKKYEFNESDIKFSKAIIDQTIINLSKGTKTNVSPEIIPYDIIFNFVGRIVFGGKVDNDKDLSFIMDFARRIFDISLFDTGFDLLHQVTDAKLMVPESYKFEDYFKWVRGLPSVEPADWLGLPKDSDKVMKEEEVRRVDEESDKLCGEVISCF